MLIPLRHSGRQGRRPKGVPVRASRTTFWAAWPPESDLCRLNLLRIKEGRLGDLRGPKGT
eukprot:12782950-Heterocapsa_arctica.AAC.1